MGTQAFAAARQGGALGIQTNTAGRHPVDAIPRLQTHATRDAMIRCRVPRIAPRATYLLESGPDT